MWSTHQSSNVWKMSKLEFNTDYLAMHGLDLKRRLKTFICFPCAIFIHCRPESFLVTHWNISKTSFRKSRAHTYDSSGKIKSLIHLFSNLCFVPARWDTI